MIYADIFIRCHIILKVHIKKDVSFIVLTFIFATVPSLSETFGLSALVLA